METIQRMSSSKRAIMLVFSEEIGGDDANSTESDAHHLDRAQELHLILSFLLDVRFYPILLASIR